MEVADWLALAALGVSMWTFFDARRIEKRLSKQSDARFAFDGIVTNPIEVKTAGLEEIVRDLSQLIADSSSSDDRRHAVSRWLRREYVHWYSSFDALLLASTEAQLEQLSILLSDFHDELAPLFETLSSGAGEGEIDMASKAVTARSASFVARVRAIIQQLRLQY